MKKKKKIETPEEQLCEMMIGNVLKNNSEK